MREIILRVIVVGDNRGRGLDREKLRISSES